MKPFQDWIANVKIEKMLKGAGLAALTGLLTFFLGYINVYDVGIFTPVAVTIIGFLLNLAKVAATKYEPEK